MTTEIQTVLVVDDEALFLRTITDGFKAYADKFGLITARSGREALDVLAKRRVDLVVTDLQMPEVSGFELLAAMTSSYPRTPVLVITAFGTPEIEERLRGLGVENYLEKPLEFRALVERILQTLEASASGRVSGITLPSLLQIIQIERKSCCVTVSAQGREGVLCFQRGDLVDAAAEGLQGDEAAYAIVCWEDAQIELSAAKQHVRRTVRQSLPSILMEGFRRKDERLRGNAAQAGPTPPSAPSAPPQDVEGQPPLALDLADLHNRPAAAGTKETRDMANAKDKLQELGNVDGFLGAGVFTPGGEELALLPGSVNNLRDIGVLANTVLMNAQKASLEMGAGRGQVVHIEGEKSHILVRCLNEGTDPLKSQPGRAHIHTVLVLKPEASLGLAKMRLSQAVEKLAEDFR